MTIYIDISDVCEFLQNHSHVSGIQRVQVETFRHFWQVAQGDIAFIIARDDPSRVHVIDPERFATIVQALDAGTAAQTDYQEMIRGIRETARPVAIMPGDVLYISGAFWAAQEIMYTLRHAKRAGAKVGFLCYDIIPISHPDYTTREVTRRFQASLDTMLGLADFALTISVNVKEELEAYNARLGVTMPVHAVPLAHEMAQPAASGATVSALISRLAPRYVLFVSTIEPRKNHAYTLEIWKRLLRELPSDAVPDLVWVGRKGWLVGDLIQRVENLDYLGGKLKILHDVSDTELADLYRQSWFTMFPSLAEGWGLPVAESLMFGKPVMSSNLTSLPEVGGAFAWYIDPHNITEGYHKVRALIDDPQGVETMQAHIRSHFVPRRWSDVCRDTLLALHNAQKEGDTRPLPSLAALPDTLFSAGSDIGPLETQNRAEMRAALLGVFPTGWYGAEDWGRWMNGLKGTIELDLGVSGAPQPCLIYLHLKAFSGWRGNSLTLIPPNGGTPVPLKLVPGQEAAFVLQLLLSPGSNVIDLVVDRTDPVGTADPRLLSIGIRACGYARVDDEATCAALHAEAQKVTQGATRSPARFLAAALQRFRLWR